MGSIERRIEALERVYAAPAHEEDSEAMARRREELKARISSAYEKAAREEAEGNPARRIVLEELEATMKRRVAERQARAG
jgi:hypothetical protein